MACRLVVVVVVVTIGVEVRIGCLSLQLTKSLSMKSQFKPSCAVVGQIVYPVLSEDPRRDSSHRQQVVNFVRCLYYVVDPWFQFVFRLVLRDTAEGGVAVGVVADFFLLVVSWWLGSSRVIIRLALWVVGFAVGGIVDACGVWGCVTFTRFSLCLHDHPHHTSLRCLWFLLHLFRQRVHVPETQKTDGGHRGVEEFESVSVGILVTSTRLWPVNVAHAH